MSDVQVDVSDDDSDFEATDDERTGGAGESSSRTGDATKDGHYDHRHDFDPKKHPRDDKGHFAEKDEGDTASGDQHARHHEEAREKLKEAARDFAKEMPRDEHGRFAPDN